MEQTEFRVVSALGHFRHALKRIWACSPAAAKVFSCVVKTLLCFMVALTTLY